MNSDRKLKRNFRYARGMQTGGALGNVASVEGTPCFCSSRTSRFIANECFFIASAYFFCSGDDVRLRRIWRDLRRQACSSHTLSAQDPSSLKTPLRFCLHDRQYLESDRVTPPPKQTDFLPLPPSLDSMLKEHIDPAQRIFSRSSCTSPFAKVSAEGCALGCLRANRVLVKHSLMLCLQQSSACGMLCWETSLSKHYPVHSLSLVYKLEGQRVCCTLRNSRCLPAHMELCTIHPS